MSIEDIEAVTSDFNAVGIEAIQKAFIELHICYKYCIEMEREYVET